MYKIFEKPIFKSFLSVIETNISKNQLGFLSYYSSSHQVHRLVDKISYLLETKLICTGTF